MLIVIKFFNKITHFSITVFLFTSSLLAAVCSDKDALEIFNEIYCRSIDSNLSMVTSHVGRMNKSRLEKLSNHLLPMPPMGCMWKRTPDKKLILVENQFFNNTQDFRIMTFSDDDNFAYLGLHDGITIQGYTETGSHFYDESLRNHYPYTSEEFTSLGIPYWRSHVLDFPDTLGSLSHLHLSTRLRSNYTPEPFGYWAQTLSATLVREMRQIRGSYMRLFLYDSTPQMTNGSKKTPGVAIPTGVLFSQYTHDEEWNKTYSIPYRFRNSVHTHVAGKKEFDFKHFEVPYELVPVVLDSSLNTKHKTIASLTAASHYSLLPRDKYDLSSIMGLRLNAESEVREVNGKLRYMTYLLDREDQNNTTRKNLKYMMRTLGHHAAKLDDISESRQMVFDHRLVDKLKKADHAQVLDDGLFDLLYQIKGQVNEHQVSRVSHDYDKVSHFRVDRRPVEIKPEKANIKAVYTDLKEWEITLNRTELGTSWAQALVDKLKDASINKKYKKIKLKISNLITKDRGRLGGIISEELLDNSNLSIELFWTLAKGRWKSETMEATFEGIHETFSKRFASTEVEAVS